MEVYDAIMKAADHIERNPHLYDHSQSFLEGSPHDNRDAGCNIVWIGRMAGITGRKTALLVANELGLKMISPNDGEYFSRLDEIAGDRYKWRRYSADCAATMRAYAAKYHGQKQRTDFIPASVRAIFDQRFQETVGVE